MKSTALSRTGALSLAVVAAFAFQTTAFAAPPAQDAAEPVDFFAARKAGDFDAKFIAANEKRGHLILENKLKKPLVIQMPEAFAGVPVLGQLLPGLPQGPAPGQGVGIPGVVNPRGPGLNGPFNIAPERLVELKPGQKRTVRLQGVCLDHGKPTPNARMKYDLVPLADYKADKRLAELMRVFGEGRYSQPAVQAVAWHYTDGLSMDQLRKVRDPKSRKIFFTKVQLDEARKLHREVKDRLDSPKKSEALSQR